MSCNCSTLKGLGEASRPMSTVEVSAFLARHPSIASRVAVTLQVQAWHLYDVNAYDEVFVVRFPGVIPPWGLQVEDSSFGLVTIQPTNTELFFTAFSPVDLHTENPVYQSPPQTCRGGQSPTWGFCPEDVTDVLFVVGLGIAIYFVSQRRKK